MTALPIVARELKVRSAHAGLHWVRALLAGFAALICLQWFVAGNSSLGISAVGRAAFHSMSWLTFVLACGATMITADCVSGERREGTLGLLFLTTLKSKDVVLGKFAATGLTTFYALLGFAPVLMVPFLVGGVTGGEVARTALALVNLTFFSLTMGLCVSVFARGQMAAILGAFAALAFLSLAPFFVGLVAHSTLALPFSALSPVTSFVLSGDAAYSLSPGNFWFALGLGQVEGWLLLVAAAFALGRNWREIYFPLALKSAPPQDRRLVGAPRVVLADRENKRRTFAPVARAVLRMRGQKEMAWFAAVISWIGSLSSALVIRQFGSVWAAAGVPMVFTLISSSLFALLAGRFFLEARRSGELELLLVTPVGARGILREQRFALMRILRAPFYLAVVGSIPAAASCISAFSGKETLGLLLGLSLTANTALGIIAICCIGMWFGTRVNSAFGLIGRAIGLVEILPLIAVNLLPLLLFGWTSGLFQFWVLAAPLLMVFKNLFFIWWARKQLRREFPTGQGKMQKRLFWQTSNAGKLSGPQPGFSQ